MFKENGFTKYIIYSPLIKEYNFHTLFPDGICLVIYKNNHRNQCIYIRGNWMKSFKNIFYHIKGNIRILNPNKFFLKTEEIFWDKKNKKIFNEKNIIISDLNGAILYAKKGINISEDFKKFKLKDISGILPL
ncbi:hypothetical protein [Blattabacterium cuenoti]|uniref:hypothetical protein n=1 Tax=Blattabacterium cuenoti TaxID=1653831 RepID=UPI001EEB3EA0|nr:hypothetical protein [Blattabacterium cuenoti]